MITAKDFLEFLRENELEYIVTVPCSNFKPLYHYMDDNNISYKCAPNENTAMGMATGYFLRTGKIPVVMVQNSGFLETLNPLTSLNAIYEIPILLIVSWRGFKKEAPEHDITGKHMISLLDCNMVKKCLGYVVADTVWKLQIKELLKNMNKTKRCGAFVIKKGDFKEYKSKSKQQSIISLSRFDAISIIKDKLRGSIFLSSTGHPTRDSFNVKDTPDFYMVGSMGHLLGIGIEVAKETQRKVVLLDGDGSAMMHMGSMALDKPDNLIHVILDNGVFGSTGDQPNLSRNPYWKSIAKGFNYHYFEVSCAKKLENALNMLPRKGPTMLRVLLNTEGRAGKRVTDFYECPEIKEGFMDDLNEPT